MRLLQRATTRTLVGMATERYRTADGLLELVVVREDGDVSIGFEGYSWHTHADVLQGEYTLIGENTTTPEDAVERFLSDLRSDVARIIVYRKAGRISDVCVSLGEPDEDKYLDADETREVRYWSK
jgi:hypothetical protein